MTGLVILTNAMPLCGVSLTKVMCLCCGFWMPWMPEAESDGEIHMLLDERHIEPKVVSSNCQAGD